MHRCKESLDLVWDSEMLQELFSSSTNKICHCDSLNDLHQRQIQRQSTVRTSALHERRHHHLQSSREMGRLRIPARSQGLGDPALRTHRRPCRRVRRARLRQVLQEGLAARQNPQAHPGGERAPLRSEDRKGLPRAP